MKEETRKWNEKVKWESEMRKWNEKMEQDSNSRTERKRTRETDREAIQEEFLSCVWTITDEGICLKAAGDCNNTSRLFHQATSNPLRWRLLLLPVPNDNAYGRWQRWQSDDNSGDDKPMTIRRQSNDDPMTIRRQLATAKMTIADNSGWRYLTTLMTQPVVVLA